MKVWIDAQLSPELARWLGLHDATDEANFDAARRANAVVMTKDRDFVQLLERAGPPPQLI